jgi:hypothetical protein
MPAPLLLSRRRSGAHDLEATDPERFEIIMRPASRFGTGKQRDVARAVSVQILDGPFVNSSFHPTRFPTLPMSRSLSAYLSGCVG